MPSAMSATLGRFPLHCTVCQFAFIIRRHGRMVDWKYQRTWRAMHPTTTPPCASTSLSEHGTRLTVVFLVFLTAVFVVRKLT
jgi:hypothetical protein